MHSFVPQPSPCLHRACGLSLMIEHKVGGHRDPRASELRDVAGRDKVPRGGGKGSQRLGVPLRPGWEGQRLTARKEVMPSDR